MDSTEPFYLTTRDVADRLSVAVSSVAKWADQGYLPCARTVGRHRRFRDSDVERFAADMEAGRIPQPDRAA